MSRTGSVPVVAVPALQFATPLELTIGLDRDAEIPRLPSAAIPGLAATAKLPGAIGATPARTMPGVIAPRTAQSFGLQSTDPLDNDMGGGFGPSSGLEGQKAAGDKVFDNASSKGKGDGADERTATGAGGNDPPDDAAPVGDDGGGPAYPHRIVRFRGQDFRATFFRPNIPIETEVIRAIGLARKTVHVTFYEFKQRGVLEALRAARERGVQVHIIVDESNMFPRAEPGDQYRRRRSNELWALMREGFAVTVVRGFGEYGIMHNKIYLIDAGERQSLAIFGSYNATWTAEHTHYENANFSVDRRRIKALMQAWNWIAQQGVDAKLAGNHAWPQTPSPNPIKPAFTVDLNGTELPGVVISPNRVPGQNIEDHLVSAIKASKKSIDASIFAIRSTKIAEALAEAHRNKVRVRVIMDRGQSTSDAFGAYAAWLAAQGIEIKTLMGPDPKSDFPLAQKMHHKFAIFDGKIVETGSANWTKYAAWSNYENAHFVDEKEDARAYRFAFEHMFSIAERLQPPAQAPPLPTDAELILDAERPPKPRPPLPPPPVPGPAPKAREIQFAGKTYPAVAMRPDTPVEPLLVDMVKSAKSSVRLALYEFTLEEVMQALRWLKKNRPKVKIELVLDQSHVYTSGRNSRGELRMPSPQILSLINEGYDVMTVRGEKHGIMHSKFVLIDADKAKGLMMTGSYNLSENSEKHHYENAVFSDDKGDLADYLANFAYMRSLAKPIDKDRLEQVLNRQSNADLGEAGEAEAEAAAGPEQPKKVKEPLRKAGDERDSKLPPPPNSDETPFDLNGEKFKRSYFSPQGGILDAWLRAIKAAKKSVEIASFGFYSRELADALVLALQEKKKINPDFEIRMAMDAGQSTLAKLDGVPVNRWLAERGLDVRILAGPNESEDPMYEKQHSKYIMIDGRFVITGSFNPSDTAENFSFENATVLMDPLDVAMFVWDFNRLFLRGWMPRTNAVAAKEKSEFR